MAFPPCFRSPKRITNVKAAMDLSPEVIAAVGSAVVGIPTIGVIVSNRLTRMRQERSNRLAITARDETVQGLVSENARLRSHNSELVKYLEAAQLRIVELQQSVGSMAAEIDSLLRAHRGDQE